MPRLDFCFLALVAASLAGCSGAPRTAQSTAVISAPSRVVFTEPVVERPADNRALTPGFQKAYFVGRIVDSKYPELMHGDGIVFRRERPERWNTAGAEGGGGYSVGPIRSMPNGSEVPAMTAADAEIHEARTSAIVDALLAQNAELADKLAEAAKVPLPAAEKPSPIVLPGSAVTTPPVQKPGATASTSTPGDTDALVTIAPSADNVIELSPSLLEPPIPGLTNPFRQRYQFETQLRETKITVSGIALGPQPSCVIGDRIYSAGDPFESFTIASIDADGIFLRKESFLLRIPMQEAAIVLRYP